MDHKTYPFILEKADPFSPTDQGGAEFIGHAAIFSNVDDGGDIIQPGAFAKTLSERGSKIALVWQHDWKSPIGRVTEIKEDDRGLYVRAKISDTSLGRDVSTLMRDGAVTGLSIGYNPVKEQTISLADGRRARSLQEVKLFEVSPVTFPMNELATVAAVKTDENLPVEEKPYPNEHACRLRDPGDFQSDSMRRMIRKHEGKEYSIIMGRLKEETTMTEQAYRYPKDIWDADLARAHCKDHDGSFEAAAPGKVLTEIATRLMDVENQIIEETKEGRVLSARNRGVVQAALDALKELLAASEPPTKEPAADEAPDKGDKPADTPEALVAQVEELRARVMARSKLLSLGR